MPTLEEKIRLLASTYTEQLQSRISRRIEEMENDDRSHFLIYQVLGITKEEGLQIDIYQNKGRFLYRYAGAFLESAAKFCLQEKYPQATSVCIPNTLSRRPVNFEIDCLLEKKAIEIKWRDATTDGDHITKEHARIKTIADAGLTPIRVMFYYPNREQAIRIQQAIETLYLGVQGEYYAADNAWEYITLITEIDLRAILEKIAEENARRL